MKDTIKRELQINFLMFTDIKKINEIPENQFQKPVSKIFAHHNAVGFITGKQGQLHTNTSVSMIWHVNRIKDKNHAITSVDA